MEVVAGRVVYKHLENKSLEHYVNEVQSSEQGIKSKVNRFTELAPNKISKKTRLQACLNRKLRKKLSLISTVNWSGNPTLKLVIESALLKKISFSKMLQTELH